MDQATKAINGIDKKYVAELNAMVKTPANVLVIGQAICALFQQQETWTKF